MLIFFIAAFLIISPMIILYTAGYRYDWQNGFLKQTGAISIDIQPKNTVIYLNGIMLKDKMPVRLNNIAPAKYFLKMSAPGYFDWTKYIEVQNKQTTYIKEISLLKKTDPQILIKEDMDNFALSKNNGFILYTVKNNGGEDIRLWNIKGQKSTLIRHLGQQAPLNLEWSSDYYATVSNLNPPYSNLIIINSQNPSEITDLAAGATSTITKFEWDDSSGQLYYGTKNGIYAFSPVGGQTAFIAKNPYLDWYMENSQLWTLQLDTTTKAYEIIKDALGFKSVFNSLDPAVPDAPVKNPKDWRILAVRQDSVLLKDTTQSEMAMITADKIYNFSGDKFLISKYNDWWLMWTQWELWSYSQGQDPYLLNRSGEHLNDVFPLDQYNTLGLIWESKATALYPYYLVTHDLLDQKIDAAAADTDNKILYFTAKINDEYGIWSLNY